MPRYTKRKVTEWGSKRGEVKKMLFEFPGAHPKVIRLNLRERGVEVTESYIKDVTRLILLEETYQTGDIVRTLKRLAEQLGGWDNLRNLVNILSE